MEIFLPLNIVKMALLRQPDVDNGSIVSWGQVTNVEIQNVISLESDSLCRDEYINELKEMPIVDDLKSTIATLFYKGDIHGK